MVNDLLLSVGEAVANLGLPDLSRLADPIKEHKDAAAAIGKIALGAWNKWQEKKKQQKQEKDQAKRDQDLADVLDAVRRSSEEVKQLARVIAERVTPDPELQGHVERFVTLVPASIRATLRHPKDPTGNTAPAGFAIRDAEDLVKLLPVRFPRFKPGDTPHFLRGWRLLEQIGAGGFGEVWKVQNSRATNLVRAVKFGHGLSAAEESLLNEGNLLNRLLKEGQHDGVVKLFDVWADGDPVPWLQYEYIAGADLAAVITVWRSWPAEQRVTAALAALDELTATVAHFHALRPFIVHRDLKPSNILFDPAAGRFKIADFGIGGVSSLRALSADLSKSVTAGAVVATCVRGAYSLLYASPQQRAGGREVDPRDDVHALGVIAYQMLTGKLDTAPGTDVDDDLAEHGAPKELVALVKACTANDPTRRPKDAGEVHARLKGIAVPEVPPPQPEPIPPVTKPVDQPTPSDAVQVDDLAIPPEPPPNSQAKKYAAWRQSVELQLQKAHQAAREYDYAQAVTLMEQVPESRRSEFYIRYWGSMRDRIAELWTRVVKDGKEMSDYGLIDALEEIVGLNPHHLEAKEWLAAFPVAERRAAAERRLDWHEKVLRRPAFRAGCAGVSASLLLFVLSLLGVNLSGVVGMPTWGLGLIVLLAVPLVAAIFLWCEGWAREDSDFENFGASLAIGFSVTTAITCFVFSLGGVNLTGLGWMSSWGLGLIFLILPPGVVCTRLGIRDDWYFDWKHATELPLCGLPLMGIPLGAIASLVLFVLSVFGVNLIGVVGLPTWGVGLIVLLGVPLVAAMLLWCEGWARDEEQMENIGASYAVGFSVVTAITCFIFSLCGVNLTGLEWMPSWGMGLIFLILPPGVILTRLGIRDR